MWERAYGVDRRTHLLLAEACSERICSVNEVICCAKSHEDKGHKARESLVTTNVELTESTQDRQSDLGRASREECCPCPVANSPLVVIVKR